jgi:hypothetical protein
LAIKTRGDDRLTQYILGGLPERERERLEAEYFEDDDAFEQLLIAEEELTDEYVRGELSAEESARFEKNYLSSPRGCERVQFARALAKAMSDARGAEAEETRDVRGIPFFTALRTRGAAWRFAFAGFVLVAAVGLTWLLVERARTQDELRRLRDERAGLSERAQEMERRAAAERARSGELLAQLEAERARPAPEAGREGDAGQQDRPSPGKAGGQAPRPSVISFLLTPGLVRGGGSRTLQVPGGDSSVVLRLNVEGGAYRSYHAVIEFAGGQQVWRADSVRPRRPAAAGGTIELPAIPARALPPGDYVLLLSGERPDGEFEGVADYSFRVVRK